MDIESKYNISSYGFLSEYNSETMPLGWDYLLPLQENISVDDGELFRKTVHKIAPPDNELDQLIERIPDLALKDQKFLYAFLGVVQAKYVWAKGEKDTEANIPKHIGKPLHAIGTIMKLPPFFNYYPCTGFNWNLKDPSKPFSLDNIRVIFSLKQKFREHVDNFFLLHIAIEAAGGKCLADMMKAKEYMIKRDNKKLVKVMENVLTSISNIVNIMKQFPVKCSPEAYYSFRHIFNGVYDKEKFPEGIKYEGVECDPILYPSVNAGQSPIIPAFDTFLGVEHQDNDKLIVHGNQQFYHPRHLQFIFDLGRAPVVKTYIESINNKELTTLYQKCAEKILNFRRVHYSIVKTYLYEKMKAHNVDLSDIAKGERHPSDLLNSFINSTQKNHVHTLQIKNRSNPGYILIPIFVVLLSLIFMKFYKSLSQGH